GGGEPALVEQEELVAGADGGNPVRQEDGGAGGGDAGGGVVQERLGVRVHGRLGRREDQQGRGAQVGAGQGGAEVLAGGQGVAQFDDGRLVALGQLLDEVVGVGDLGGLDDLRQGVGRVAGADVVGHRVVEDEVVHQHRADLGPQGVERDPAQVVLVDADLA